MRAGCAWMVCWGVITILGLAGCAGMSVQPDSPAVLEARVRAQWDALVKQDWNTVYDFSTQAFKDRVPRAQFVAKANRGFAEYEIKEVQITGPGEGVSYTRFVEKVMGFDLPGTEKEFWVMENGNWFRKR